MSRCPVETLLAMAGDDGKYMVTGILPVSRKVVDVAGPFETRAEADTWISDQIKAELFDEDGRE